MISQIESFFEKKLYQLWIKKLTSGDIVYKDENMYFDWIWTEKITQGQPERFGVMVNLNFKEFQEIASKNRITSQSKQPAVNPICALEDISQLITIIDDLHLQFHIKQYSPAGILAVTKEHRSNVNKEDILAVLKLSRSMPDRFFWWSGPNSGGTQPHTHFHGHFLHSFGNELPIEQASRKNLDQRSGVVISRLEHYPVWGLTFSIADELEPVAELAELAIQELHHPFNLIFIKHELYIIGRTKKISSVHPSNIGSAEIAGVFICDSPEKAKELNYEKITAIIAETGLSADLQYAWEERLFLRLEALKVLE